LADFEMKEEGIAMGESLMASGQDRRRFLQTVGMVGLAAALPQIAAAETDVKGADLKTPSGKPLRGLYPIMETPFTPDDKLNTDALANEVKFLNRGRVAGMIWPVFASSWSTLSDAERIEGAETILAAGKGGKTAMAIAVQNTAWDIPTSVRYAKHAAEHGADAIVAIPPNNGWNVSDQAVIDYYKTIAAATELPLIVQTRGTISVDLMLEMFKQIPTMKATKDEVGDTLARAGQLIQGTDNKLAVWAAGGGTGPQLMQDSAAGDCGAVSDAAVCGPAAAGDGVLLGGQEARGVRHVEPGAGVCDAAGRERANDGAARSVSGGDEVAAAADGAGGKAGRRWWWCGRRRAGGGGGARRGAAAPLTDKDKQFLKDALEEYLRPYMRG
jgi:dihydrodipicolinate synthase/N-acetylneuraminate lyase